MKKTIAASVLSALVALGSAPAVAEFQPTGQSTGVFAGAALGALAGGPLGLVLGSAAGGLIGLERDRRDEIDAAQNELTNLRKQAAASERDRQELARRSSEREQLACTAGTEAGAALLAIENGFSISVPFRTGSDRIEAERARELGRLAEALKSLPQLMVHIDGRTDSRGGATANRELGTRRAAAVRTLLEGSGIPPQRIAQTASGLQYASHGREDAEGLFYDRRVVVTFHHLPK